MTEHTKLFREWKKRLGLMDWSIRLYDKVRADYMAIEDAVGCAQWQESSKTAFIQILDPVDYGQRVTPFDWEKTLVHELLHLKMSLVSYEVDALQERVTHQLIDDLARAFVDAKI